MILTVVANIGGLVDMPIEQLALVAVWILSRIYQKTKES
jgi:hypothetical protein